MPDRALGRHRPDDAEGAPTGVGVTRSSRCALDPVFPDQRAREMVSGCPNAHLTVIDEASLFIHEERPAEVSQALLPVLTGRGR